jgi:hypothetical protein
MNQLLVRVKEVDLVSYLRDVKILLLRQVLQQVGVELID